MAWPFRVRGGGRGSGSRKPAELGAPRWGREEGPRGRAQASSQLQIQPVPGGGRGRKFRPQRRRLLTLEAPALPLLVPKRSPGFRGARSSWWPAWRGAVASLQATSRTPPPLPFGLARPKSTERSQSLFRPFSPLPPPRNTAQDPRRIALFLKS